MIYNVPALTQIVFIYQKINARNMSDTETEQMAAVAICSKKAASVVVHLTKRRYKLEKLQII